MDDQTAIGKAIERLSASRGMSYSQAADHLRTSEGALMLEAVRRENGRAEVRVSSKPAEPTHALDAPPDLTEADLPDELLRAAQVAVLDGGLPFGSICSCDRPRATLPRGGEVCLNPDCEHYEEVYR